MRYLYAIISVWLWSLFIIWLSKGTIAVSSDVQLLSLAIIAAGTLAGGE